MLRKSRTVLAAIALFGFLALVLAGAGWGIVTLKLYARMWAPYVQTYRAASGMSDPMLLGGRVSLGAVAFHCAALVILMAPWALIAASCFMRFVAMVDDYFAHSLNHGTD